MQGMNNTRLEYSTNFFAVLYQIKKLNCVDSNIFQLSEVPIQVLISLFQSILSMVPYSRIVGKNDVSPF